MPAYGGDVKGDCLAGRKTCQIAGTWAALAAFVLVSLAFQAQALGQALEKVPVPEPQGHTLMWKATSPEGKELYLLGSLHMARTSFYPLKDILYESFDRCGTLALELDPESAGLQDSLGIVMEKGFYNDGSSLTDHLDPELAGMVAPYLEGFRGAQFAAMKPWLAAVTLSVMELERMGYLVKEGVDRHFLARARDRGMAFVELESPDEQLGIFADMSDEESVMFLRATLIELKDVERFMDEMVGAWLEGDASRFEDAFFSTYKLWPELAPLLDRVIFSRNATMFERLQPLLEQSDRPVFAVIGSGHLVGSRGVPAMFEQAGWRMEKF
jgi:uncharacterized protein YbaP (TraB family)